MTTTMMMTEIKFSNVEVKTFATKSIKSKVRKVLKGEEKEEEGGGGGVEGGGGGGRKTESHSFPPFFYLGKTLLLNIKKQLN